MTLQHLPREIADTHIVTTINALVDSANGSVQSVAAPAHSTSAGVAGQIAHDGTYVYVCLATNTWVRITPTTTSF
jgi:hypothetical protein